MMMPFSSCFLLSLCLIMFYSCRLTAAATLAVSLAKRDDPDPIRCYSGNLDTTRYLPETYFLGFPTRFQVCTSKSGYDRNLGCQCRGKELRCGWSPTVQIQWLVAACMEACSCGIGTIINRSKYTGNIIVPKDIAARVGFVNSYVTPTDHSVGGGASHSVNPNPSQQYECAKTCTSVDHGCPLFSAGFCKCYAPPATAEFWHTGNCGLVPHIGFPVHTGSHGRRSYNLDLAQQRHSYYLNATAHFASPNGATALPGPPPELHVQLASGMLPSPCNSSYVSFACGDSPDGIVHEPPENWLGALLPEGAKELPPVPKEFLKIRKL